MPRKKFDDEIEKAFKNVEQLLNGMLNDRSVPRNIKRVATRCIDEINTSEETQGIIASNVMYQIDDVSTDPNVPFHSRTTVYRILSLLEKIKDE